MSIFTLWLDWHFKEVPKAILEIWRGFIRFLFNFFSISILAKSWFSHWRRYRYSYSKNFSIGTNLGNFIFNIFSRLIGTILRTAVIVFGLVMEILVLGSGLVFLISWIFLPVLLILGFLR